MTKQIPGNFPSPYFLSDLIDVDLNDSKTYLTGCSTDEYHCTNANYNRGSNPYKIYPDEGDEFQGFLDTSSPTCPTCSNNIGCNAGQTGGNESCLCGGIPYTGNYCAVKRVAFNGQPTACCLQSTSAGKGINAAVTGLNIGGMFNWYWMQDPDYVKYTCDPNYRDGSNCGEVAPDIALQCSWIAKEGTRKAWSSEQPTNKEPYGYCNNFITNSTSQASVNVVLQSAVSALATNDTPGHKYSDFGISQPENAPFIANILSGCKSRGKGSCDSGLANLCSKYTRDDIFGFYQKYLELTQKPNKTEYENNLQTAYANAFTACGCHLPKKDYAKWNKIGVDESNFSCDPLCMLPGVIRQYINGQEAECDQNLCILDNITIDILNSNIPGGITFSTVCGDCGSSNEGGSGGCRCIFSGIDIFQSGSSVGNINFQQSCGGNCQIPDPNQEGNFIPINCQTGFPISGGGPQNPSTFTSLLKWLSDHAAIVIVLIVIFLVLIITIIWITHKEPRKHKGPGESVTLSDMFEDFDDYVSYY